MTIPDNHYVNNKDFFDALVEYRQKVIDAENSDEPRPRVPNYVGECIMKIAVHLATKPNFSNYPFKEEMISDGIENCLRYIDNFNPETSKNPFAYFTQIIYWAFVRRIKKEKKHLYTKFKATEEADIMNLTSDAQPQDRGKVYDDGIKRGEWSQEFVENFIRDFEETNSRPKKKRKKESNDEQREDTAERNGESEGSPGKG